MYNIGGGRHSNCSMLEAIELCERIAGRPIRWTYTDSNRTGDHIWWVSDVRKFASHYPGWTLTYSLERTIAEIHGEVVERDAATRAR